MIRRAYFFVAYYLSWIAFAGGAIVLMVVCAGLLVAYRGEARAARVRESIRRFFGAWVWWLGITRLVKIEWHFPFGALVRPAVCVANHPSLLDATILLPRLRDSICIFKPSMRRNPLLGPVALMAGYASRDAGVDLIREVASKVRQGRTLLVFPEGTRTDTNAALNALKPGFALIARRAGVPVQVLIIRTRRDLFPRGRPWWSLPKLPTQIDILVDRLIPTDTDQPVSEIVSLVRQRFAAQLAAFQ